MKTNRVEGVHWKTLADGTVVHWTFGKSTDGSYWCERTFCAPDTSAMHKALRTLVEMPDKPAVNAFMRDAAKTGRLSQEREVFESVNDLAAYLAEHEDVEIALAAVSPLNRTSDARMGHVNDLP